MLTDERYYELLNEATVDCYDEVEEFAGVLCTVEDNLQFPLPATLMNESVIVHGINEGRSSPHCGIVATVERNGRTYDVSLADLAFADIDPISAEWLALYRRWSDMQLSGALLLSRYSADGYSSGRRQSLRRGQTARASGLSNA